MVPGPGPDPEPEMIYRLKDFPVLVESSRDRARVRAWVSNMLQRASPGNVHLPLPRKVLRCIAANDPCTPDEHDICGCPECMRNYEKVPITDLPLLPALES